MMGRFERLTATAMAGVAGKNALVNLQIVLKIESVAGIPIFLACQRGEKFSAEERGVLAR